MIAHIPGWVFAVFVLLLALGVWMSRPRAFSPSGAVVMAVVFPIYSLYGVISSFGIAAVPVVSWTAALLVSILLGEPVFGPAKLARVSGTAKAQVPGSWLPLGLMMGIFVVKFAIGSVRGSHSPVGGQAWFAPAVCFALGALSGGFVSRALTIRRFLARATGDA